MLTWVQCVCVCVYGGLSSFDTALILEPVHFIRGIKTFKLLQFFSIGVY